MAEVKLTLEQLTKIHEIGTRLSRDPAFLAAVENAMKGVLPTVPSDTGQSSAEVPTGNEPKVERMVSFGWSIPVDQNDCASAAAVVAFAVGSFIAFKESE